MSSLEDDALRRIRWPRSSFLPALTLRTNDMFGPIPPNIQIGNQPLGVAEHDQTRCYLCLTRAYNRLVLLDRQLADIGGQVFYSVDISLI